MKATVTCFCVSIMFCIILICLQVNTNNVTSPNGLRKRALVIFFTRSPVANKQGIARVSCVSGCSCNSFELDGLNSDFYATLGAGSAEVGYVFYSFIYYFNILLSN
jgi:hypothetical protein